MVMMGEKYVFFIYEVVRTADVGWARQQRLKFIQSEPYLSLIHSQCVIFNLSLSLNQMFPYLFLFNFLSLLLSLLLYPSLIPIFSLLSSFQGSIPVFYLQIEFHRMFLLCPRNIQLSAYLLKRKSCSQNSPQFTNNCTFTWTLYWYFGQHLQL